ncbi:LmeA family phospholipid-binding protein [Gulosibacter molinativorax]|uniref:DUF2993 domain-containing protein n=1 Tax=Gulosibacter molinativorax TaxID=256821 RepID=A0ABT7C3R8_9MICO|nr:DUF2993 domain-containing protein [Gulosibacter molinativorax]MDJ1369889.1 DUF2993 domain-containing protein [Gulosibacter molinativorax]QUY61854.1 Hypotetical protein [Gulosibacter molinativorax]
MAVNSEASASRAEASDALPDFGQPAYELPGYGEQDRARPNGVRWGRLLVWLAVLLVVLAIAAELLTRILVGRIAASQIEESMPDGVVAEVSASATGWCVLCEVIGGELSGLDIEGSNVYFGAAKGSIDIAAESVTLTDPVEIGSAEGTVRIGEESLNRLLADATAEYGITMHAIDLQDGSFGYSTAVSVFGVDVTLDVVANARLQSGGRIQIFAESISVHSGASGADIPVDPEQFTLEFCVAEHLPESLEITSVEVVEDGLEVGYRTTEPMTITDKVFDTRGSCSAA